MTTDRFVAVVSYGHAHHDRGVVVEDGDGRLVVKWADGTPDPVTRNRRGWLIHDHGVHLRILSRRAADAEPILAAYQVAFDAAVGEVADGR